MRYSISNIAWDNTMDKQVYLLMNQYHFTGLEIAPTRVFPENPYDDLAKAKAWSQSLYGSFGLQISSMQSIWYGRQEKLFGSDDERKALLDYTKKAIDFAAVIGCKNLVFGCPRNRSIPEGAVPDAAIPFFRELGDYALTKETAVAIEPNPPIYNTNYINTTKEALALIQEVNSKGFLLNLDVGTMIENQESTALLKGNVQYISHVHISEPGLGPLKERALHKELIQFLQTQNYAGFISIEMGKQGSFAIVEEMMNYVKSVADSAANTR